MNYQTSFYADFNYELLGNVLVIYDLNKGNKSLTHDIGRVLHFLKSKVPFLSSKKIIYRDSMGVFDGVEIDQTGEFIEFYSLGERVLDKALNKVNLMH